MQTIPGRFMGKKARVGGIAFVNGRLAFFAGYCDGCRGKCVMTREEAENFARNFRSKRMSLEQRLLLRMIKKRTL